jgi:hypothetical protein
MSWITKIRKNKATMRYCLLLGIALLFVSWFMFYDFVPIHLAIIDEEFVEYHLPLEHIPLKSIVLISILSIVGFVLISLYDVILAVGSEFVCASNIFITVQQLEKAIVMMFIGGLLICISFIREKPWKNSG